MAVIRLIWFTFMIEHFWRLKIDFITFSNNLLACDARCWLVTPDVGHFFYLLFGFVIFELKHRITTVILLHVHTWYGMMSSVKPQISHSLATNIMLYRVAQTIKSDKRAKQTGCELLECGFVCARDYNSFRFRWVRHIEDALEKLRYVQ